MFDIDLYGLLEYILWKKSCDKVQKYIRILKVLGADINVQDKHGNTPLYIATKSGNEVAVKTLSKFQEIEISQRLEWLHAPRLGYGRRAKKHRQCLASAWSGTL